MVTFLDPRFHETKQEEFDGDIKDRPTSLRTDLPVNRAFATQSPGVKSGLY